VNYYLVDPNAVWVVGQWIKGQLFDKSPSHRRWSTVSVAMCSDHDGGYWSMTLKKYSTSSGPSSGRSVQCTAFFAFVWPNSARSELGRMCLAISCVTTSPTDSDVTEKQRYTVCC